MGTLLLITPFYCFTAANDQSAQKESITHTTAETKSSSWSEYFSSLISSITNFIKQTVTTIQAYFISTPTTTQQQHSELNNTTEKISPPEKQQPQEIKEPTSAPITQEQSESKALVTINQQELALQKAATTARKSQPELPTQQETEDLPLLILSIQDSLNDITEINSPAIQKEILGDIINKSKQLDNLIKELPRNQQPEWFAQQLILLTPTNKTALKKALSTEIHHNWRQHGNDIIQSSLDAVKKGITSATIGLMMQAAQMGTGNLLMLDTNALLISGLTSTVGAALFALSSYSTNKATSTLVSSIGAKTFSESSLIPYVQQAQGMRFNLTIPSFTGPIINWITSEAIAVAHEMLEKNGEIFKTINNINLTHALIVRPSSPVNNELVATIVPQVQALVGNEKIANILTQIGWITLKSATIGGLLYGMGLGYANSSALESVGYAALTGLAQGSVGALAAITHKEPGALITIAGTPLAMLRIGNATPQSAATATIQVVAEEVTNLLINESEKAGGLLQTLHKGKNALGQAMWNRWSSMWADISDAFETIQEIEPLPI